MYKPNYKSKCCKADVIVSSGVPDFENQKDSKGQTLHYECTKCKKACDIAEEIKMPKLPKMPKSLKKRLDKNRRWRARQVKKGIKTDFGKGLAVCLVKFSSHLQNEWVRRIEAVDFFYRRLKGDRKKLEKYDRSIKEAVEYSDILMKFRKTSNKWISEEMELWANGASDHLYEMRVPEEWEKDLIGKKVAELQNLGLKIGHGFTKIIWTVRDLRKLSDLTEEIAFLLDKKIRLNPDKGMYS